MALTPDMYRSSATIAPVEEERKPNPALGVLSSLGVSVNNPTKIEDLEALFRSDDLTVRVFTKQHLWPDALGERFNDKTGKFRVGWKDRLLFGRSAEDAPSEWDAIRMAEKAFHVSVNRKVGTLQIIFESPRSSGAAEAVRKYLEEAKSRLQEEAFARATQNKRFIEEQIGKTMDPLSRDRLYAIYGQELEREMLARNREQFGFKVIDSPRIPDRKAGPDRIWTVLVGSVLAFLIGCAVTVLISRWNRE